MKTKLANVKMMEQSLSKLVDKELNIKVAYRLSKILKVVGEELSELEKARQKLVKKYSDDTKTDKDSETNQQELKVSKENEQKFFKEYSQLLEEEVEFDIKPVSIEELEGVSLTPRDISFLSDIIICDDNDKTNNQK